MGSALLPLVLHYLLSIDCGSLLTGAAGGVLPPVGGVSFSFFLTSMNDVPTCPH